MFYQGEALNFGLDRGNFPVSVINGRPQGFLGTTVLCVRKDKETAMGADGQVTLGDMIVKDSAVKLRKMNEGKVLVGFAGSTADALTLCERFEGSLSAHKGNLRKAAVELAKVWRTEKALRHLSAMLLVADCEITLLISGTGDVLEIEDGIASIGSGSKSALSAARVLVRLTDLSAKTIAQEALMETAKMCIYTNSSIKVEVL